MNPFAPLVTKASDRQPQARCVADACRQLVQKYGGDGRHCTDHLRELDKKHAYRVLIRENATGEIRLSKKFEFKFSPYWWTDGNMGCDCNRWIEWHRAGGQEPNMDDAKCDHEGAKAFSVPCAILANGTVVLVDQKEPAIFVEYPPTELEA